MEEITISKKVNVGDAGVPFNVEVTFWYSEDADAVVIHQNEDAGGPENCPMWWPDKIKEIIEDHFENKKVIFN